MRLILRSLALCALALPALAASAGAQSYPPQTTLGYGKPPGIDRPSYLEPIIDPVFGTQVTRITRLRPLNPRRPIVRHAYSKVQPWNSDESLLLVGAGDPRLILDGRTYEHLRLFDSASDPTWSNVDPQRIYGVNGNVFGYHDLSASGPEHLTAIRRFREYRELSIGFGEGNLSNDDRYAALIGVRPSGRRDLVVYDLVAAEVSGRRSFGRGLDNATMSQSGEYVVVVWGREGRRRAEGVEAFDRELDFVRQLTRFSQHGDVGYSAAGAEVWVSYSGGRQRSIGAYPLAGGPPITVIDADPGTWGGHVSCRNLERPGWCYISDVGHSPRLWRGYDQVWGQQIAPDGPAEVFAHEHHSYDAGYYHQPQAVPSRDGSRVLWASDWDGGRSAAVFDYVASAPPPGG